MLTNLQCRQNSNPSLLENFVHFSIHFRCDLEYMKTVIKLAGKMIDTLKSSFHTISKEELFCFKLNLTNSI